MKYLVSVLLVIFLTGCKSTTGHRDFYEPYNGSENIDQKFLLKEGEVPKIYNTNMGSINDNVYTLLTKGYVLVGRSAFNGQHEGEDSLIKQAKIVRASVIVTASSFTNNVTTVSPLLLPSSSISTHSGNISGSILGSNLQTSSVNGQYTGTTITQETKIIPIERTTKIYDQTAYYLVKTDSHKIGKTGIAMIPLPYQYRKKYGVNTGAMIRIVMDKSPAFYANLMRFDVIKAIDDERVLDMEDAFNKIKSSKDLKFTIQRDDKELDVVVDLTLDKRQ